MRCTVASMRRFALKLLVFITLGAIGNYAIGWGFAIASSKVPYDTDLIAELQTQAREKEQSHFPRKAFRGLGRDVIVTAWMETEPNVTAVNECAQRCGFPYRSLEGSWIRTLSYAKGEQPSHLLQRPGPLIQSAVCETAIDTTWPLDLGQGSTWLSLEKSSIILPYRPIWPGFAINTVFYTAVLWLLFAAPFALRRRRRIKRGLCPKCAYPVGASEVCTECGKQLPSPSR
jgi:hypothetical protein